MYILCSQLVNAQLLAILLSYVAILKKKFYVHIIYTHQEKPKWKVLFAIWRMITLFLVKHSHLYNEAYDSGARQEKDHACLAEQSYTN